jgi:stage II sporulation protein D
VGFVVMDGRRFRGSLTIMRQGDNLLVINSLPVEDYLKGVVPLEIGARNQSEAAAVAAQAVSARSFTYARLEVRRRDASRLYDMVAAVTDQAYAGVDSELDLATEQLKATSGLVIKFGGRVVEAVYSSSCGGITADAAEVWPFGGQPYLKSTSDSIPGGRGAYCDISPRYSWSAALNSSELVASLDTYMRNYVSVNGRINWVERITAGPKSPSGRVKSLLVTTNTGRHEVTGDKIRFVLRNAGGEILRSTRFDISSVEETGAGVVRVEARGTGYGHGVGMCQWGAIGRARAGQDFRQILGAYYSGVRIESIDARSE